MVQRRISPRDIEQLSAYMDNQLRPADRKRLEIRLRSQPGLQAELESLRRTRLMLRDLPRRRAPRNFTLTPAMVGARQLQSWQPVFGLVSALAVVLLVFVLLGDFLVIPGYVGMFPVSQAPSAGENQSFTMQAGEEALIFPTEASSPSDSSTGQTELPAAKAFGPPTGTATPTVTLTAEILADSLPETAFDEPAMGQPAPFEEGTPPIGGGAADETGLGAGMPPAIPMATSTLEVRELPTEALVGAVEPSTLPAEGLQDTGPAAKVEAAEPEGLSDQLWVQVVFWMVELLLACLVVAAGVFSTYLWIKNRK